MAEQVVGLGTDVPPGDAVIPKVTEAPGARVPFQPALLAAITPAVEALVALHICVTVMPQGTLTFHALTVVDPLFVTVTLMLRAVPQSEVVTVLTLRAGPAVAAEAAVPVTSVEARSAAPERAPAAAATLVERVIPDQTMLPPWTQADMRDAAHMK